MVKRKCLVCHRMFTLRPYATAQKTCSPECREIRAKRVTARNNRTRSGVRAEQRVPKAIRDIRPKWCKVIQCDVIKNTVKECKETKRDLREVMSIRWETETKCLACQDKQFAEMLKLLGVEYHKRSKGKKKKKNEDTVR